MGRADPAFFPSQRAYQNSDQAFIDAWKQAIDSYESIFSGITLFIGADSGDDFPNFSQQRSRRMPTTRCSQSTARTRPRPRLCRAKRKPKSLSYFVTVTGLNGKGTQVGGMTASSAVDHRQYRRPRREGAHRLYRPRPCLRSSAGQNSIFRFRARTFRQRDVPLPAAIAPASRLRRALTT